MARRDNSTPIGSLAPLVRELARKHLKCDTQTELADTLKIGLTLVHRAWTGGWIEEPLKPGIGDSFLDRFCAVLAQEADRAEVRNSHRTDLQKRDENAAKTGTEIARHGIGPPADWQDVLRAAILGDNRDIEEARNAIGFIRGFLNQRGPFNDFLIAEAATRGAIAKHAEAATTRRARAKKPKKKAEGE